VLLLSLITSSFGYAWAAKRYRSLWMGGVIVHGVGYFIVLVLAVILGWYP
jgi:hypothetical protein